MEGIWILFMILGIISKILESNKKKNLNKPKQKLPDLDVSAKKFIYDISENIKDFIEDEDEDEDESTMTSPPIFMDETSRPEEVILTTDSLVEGECAPSAHMGKSLEGHATEGQAIPGIRSEGKGTEGYKNRGSIHGGFTEHIDLGRGEGYTSFNHFKKDRIEPIAVDMQIEEETYDIDLMDKMIWKEILSEPVSRRRYGSK